MPWTTFEEIEAWRVARVLNQRGWEILQSGAFARFLSYTQRSCSEVRSQLARALDRKHIGQSDFEELSTLTNEIHRKSGGLIKHLRGK